MKGAQISDAGFGDTGNAYLRTSDGNPYVRRTAESAFAETVKSASDEELALRLKGDRDEEAFNEIVDRYADIVFMLALRVTLDAYDAGEVLQEAFLSIEKPDSFREGMKFTTWFYGIVLGLCFTRLGAEKNNKKSESLDEYPPFREHRALERVYGSRHTGFSDAAAAEECLGKIGRAMGELPAGYRAVFQLAYVEGYTDREVAEILGISVEGVRTRIRRARFFLTERLSDYFYRPEGSRRVGGYEAVSS